ncbi:MAG: LPS assembly lipoprotein LptE [Beijerinckiaceae bacterium]
MPRRTVCRRVALSAAAAIVALGVSGCLRPLYGPTAGGRDLPGELAAIDVKEIPDRVGHYLRSELIFMLDGSGEPKPKKYLVEIKPTVTQTTAVVDSVSARADAASLIGTATYTLTPIGGGAAITSGTATMTTTYDRTAQRFGNVRAARDAEIRLAKALAEQIRNRLASVLSER